VLSADERIDTIDSFVRFIRALDALSARKITGNDARGKVTRFLSKCHPRMRQWYQRVLAHDLKLGISKTTVEKVFGSGFWSGVDDNSFHFHGCCLAKKFEDIYSGDSLPEFPLAAEFKLDGERALVFVFPDAGDGEKVLFFSRKGLRKTEIEGVSALTKQFLHLSAKVNVLGGFPENAPIFFDGEFIASDWNQTSSVVSKTTGFNAQEFLVRVQIVIFDWCPIDAYIKKGFELKWLDRKKISRKR
jgi:hypothetical protein